MDHKSTLLTNLGRTVRALRNARAWTRRQLAERSGVSERFLAEIESGRGNPSLLRLSAVAQGLDTTPIALLAAHPIVDPGAGPIAGCRIVALLGLRGAGKSSVGGALAERLRLPFVELDAVVEQQAGLTLSEMFEMHGPAYYRRMERQALESLLAADKPLVLSTGGGLVTESSTYERLRAHAHTVWLRATPEDHWQRVVAQGDTRPMRGHDEAFAHLCAILAERERLYALAEWTVDTSSTGIAELCAELADRFGALAGSTAP
jgi:XRE family aerobic/anaerobic benzoate catabolism transcriptional regulator